MILKGLDDITEDVLLALVTDGVAEGRAIDYKREVPANSDEDKNEFLGDVSFFANSGRPT